MFGGMFGGRGSQGGLMPMMDGFGGFGSDDEDDDEDEDDDDDDEDEESEESEDSVVGQVVSAPADTDSSAVVEQGPVESGLGTSGEGSASVSTYTPADAGPGIDTAVDAAYKAGFRGDALRNIVAIAGPESGYNTEAYNPVGADDSYGLTQINMEGNLGPARREEFGLSSNEELHDPYTNMTAAYGVSGGGENFSPWTTYVDGKHEGYLDDADAAIARWLALNSG